MTMHDTPNPTKSTAIIAACALAGVGLGFAAGWLGRGAAHDRPVAGQESPRFQPGLPLEDGAPSGEAPAAEGGGRGQGTTGGTAATSGARGSLTDRLGAALALEDPLARASRVSELLLGLGPDNLPDVLLQLEGGPRSNMDDALFREFLSAWAKFDGKGALDYARGIGVDDAERDIRRVRGGDDAVMRECAIGDPDGAAAYLEQVEPGRNKEELSHALVAGLADTDIDRAVEQALLNTRSRARGWSINLLARKMMETGGAESLDTWIAGMNPETTEGNEILSFKTAAFSEVAELMAEKDPQSAADWFRGHLGEDYVDSRAYYEVAQEIGGEDRGARASWISGLPAGKERDQALAETVRRWADDDAGPASAWLAQQPLDASYDGAKYSLAREIFGEDPAAAMSWGQSITDPKQQRETLIRFGREWMKRDEGAAASWLANSSLPSEILVPLARMIRDDA